jgi:hypothetical protein
MSELFTRRQVRMMWGGLLLVCAVVVGLIYLGIHAGLSDPTKGMSPAP